MSLFLSQRVGEAMGWRCNSCGVESTLIVVKGGMPDTPVGWAWDNWPGGPHHYCPPCRIALGLEPGFDTESLDDDDESEQSSVD